MLTDLAMPFAKNPSQQNPRMRIAGSIHSHQRERSVTTLRSVLSTGRRGRNRIEAFPRGLEALLAKLRFQPLKDAAK